MLETEELYLEQSKIIQEQKLTLQYELDKLNYDIGKKELEVKENEFGAIPFYALADDFSFLQMIHRERYLRKVIKSLDRKMMALEVLICRGQQ